MDLGVGVHGHRLSQMKRLQQINEQLANLYQNTPPMNGDPAAKNGGQKRVFIRIACVLSSCNSGVDWFMVGYTGAGGQNGSALS